ncbi:MAG: 2-amino-4-hydroxy-6-hydroxymethyldihydropteridine diphosphokinase [Gammaproteobacteria bacterium]|nr:2-amino-4-hydroxy-6-hydroxymethyldihydropteridine diphosphokinase [Gammaproteobacteria bacterium]
MSRVYVSIGSNVDRENNIRGAVQALRERYAFLTLSCVYETAAEGFDGAAFYNLVAGFDTDEPVEHVRQALAGIETAHGRKRGDARFSPRTLDIDILLYGDLIRHGDDYDIPRGEIVKYAFVLGPLAEIAPDLKHPETGERLHAMWDKFTGRRELRPVELTFD